ncbi:hypothetical protein N0V90_004444 [Kalmusia sp. IMI 367209]|nr:hypothetical protein N0V90_004444 [Kalmusia sp. IMI 367209]
MDPSLASVTTAALVDEMVAIPQHEDVPPTPLAPISTMAPNSEGPGSSPLSSPEPKYDEPLYTEINIPLPTLPKPKAIPALTKVRPKSHSTSSFRPFHRRGSSSDSTRKSGEEWPRIKKEVKSKEVAAAMNLTGRHHRSGTIDALAVVPAVLVLSAELFTPGEGKKRRDEGKWEDGMI